MKDQSAKGLLVFSTITCLLCLLDPLTIIGSLLALVLAWVWRGRSMKSSKNIKEYESSSLKMDHDVTKFLLILSSVFFAYHVAKYLIVVLGYTSK